MMIMFPFYFAYDLKPDEGSNDKNLVVDLDDNNHNLVVDIHDNNNNVINIFLSQLITFSPSSCHSDSMHMVLI